MKHHQGRNHSNKLARNPSLSDMDNTRLSKLKRKVFNGFDCQPMVQSRYGFQGALPLNPCNQLNILSNPNRSLYQSFYKNKEKQQGYKASVAMSLAEKNKLSLLPLQRTIKREERQ